MIKSIISEATLKHTCSVIMLHGLGDSGEGWAHLGDMMRLDHCRFVYPTAPTIPITLNGGYPMNAWYDIASLDRINAREDKVGLLNTATQIQSLIQAEMDLGIPNSRIVLAGFSQGGASALFTALTSSIKLGGVVSLSGYLPLSSEIETLKRTANDHTPMLLCHGTSDEVVKFDFGKKTFEKLSDMGMNVDFKSYPGLGHSSSEKEMQDLKSFLVKILA